MLISQGESSLGTGRRFGSTEQSSGMDEIPRLMVTYHVIPEPSSAGLLAAGLTGLMLARNRRSNRR
jgi:hypothetical protein